MGVIHIGLFLLVCAFAWVLRGRTPAALGLFRVALTLAAVPYALHVTHLWRFVHGFGPPAEPPKGIYPGLVVFAVASLAAVAAGLAVALVWSRRTPLRSSLLPVALGAVFRLFLLPLLDWRLPGTLVLDNTAFLWLGGFSLLATAALAVTAWGALGRARRTAGARGDVRLPKKPLACGLLLAGLLVGAATGCERAEQGRAREGGPDARARADSSAVIALVADFGQRLERVPLLAPDSILIEALREEYSGLVAPQLLARWIRNPRSAPGRLTSSPWPDTIVTRGMTRRGEDEIGIQGEVLERTSADLVAGRVSGRMPVRLTAIREGGRWWIGAFDPSALSGPSDGLDSLAPAGAAAVVQAYYDAIHARRFEDAYALWADGGTASGQSFEAFRRGYDRTARVEASVGAPGPLGAAAGSRYVEVPIRLIAWMEDGSREVYGGRFTLRRSVVDGATPEQRSWRLYAARIRRVEQRSSR